MVSLKLACVVLMCMVVVGAPMAQAITCGDVTQKLRQCIPYLMKGGTATPGCCSGLKSLVGAATTTPDSKTLCNCLKSAASAISGISDKFAQSLPAQCKVNVPYKFSTSTNCAHQVLKKRAA